MTEWDKAVVKNALQRAAEYLELTVDKAAAAVALDCRCALVVIERQKMGVQE